MGSTFDVVHACPRTSTSISYTMGFGYPIWLVHSCWVALPREFCRPRPGPGGLFSRATCACAVGRSAFGTSSSSLNGLRINGLVGNTSVNSSSPKAAETAENAPLADSQPLSDRYGTPVQ